jgi:hypothetical protein
VCVLSACLKSTYQLKLLARVPIFNPNFLSACIEGDLHVLFYKTIAGSGKIKPVRLPPRAAPKVGELAAVAALPRKGGGRVLCSGQGAGAVHMHGKALVLLVLGVPLVPYLLSQSSVAFCCCVLATPFGFNLPRPAAALSGALSGVVLLQVLEVAIDASDVPSDYILAILSQCSTFPEVLIFFLKGKLTVRDVLLYLDGRQRGRDARGVYTRLQAVGRRLPPTEHAWLPTACPAGQVHVAAAAPGWTGLTLHGQLLRLKRT